VGKLVERLLDEKTALCIEVQELKAEVKRQQKRLDLYAAVFAQFKVLMEDANVSM